MRIGKLKRAALMAAVIGSTAVMTGTGALAAASATVGTVSGALTPAYVSVPNLALIG